MPDFSETLWLPVLREGTHPASPKLRSVTSRTDASKHAIKRACHIGYKHSASKRRCVPLAVCLVFRSSVRFSATRLVILQEVFINPSSAEKPL
jgi:hypothetical protein